MSVVTSNSTKKSTYALLASNLAIIVLTVLSDINLITLMWIYWCQSVIIGIQTVPELFKNGVGLGFILLMFFTVHYGGFHAGYAFFLYSFSNGVVEVNINGVPTAVDYGSVDVQLVLFGALLFAVNHFYSYMVHGAGRSSNAVVAMFKPYLRIFPMHIAVIFSIYFVGSRVGVLMFEVLKTIGDLIGHKLTHLKPTKDYERYAELYKLQR